MEGNWNCHEIRVRYQETDQMGVVYHANYLNWFEIGRTEWIRSHGIAYGEIERKGLLLPVTDLEISYKQPAKYDDIVQVWTKLSSFSYIRLEFEVKVTRNDTLLVEGRTKHVWVNREFKPVRLDKTAPELFSLLKEKYKA
ncbi:acyl-CoA thioesterase [Marinicrinis lubricantis]|uniref:Acyl-CoA thioesterase n=1 Tax=Marinicrinis lubricantis TaxID=2086470 RepID=A0ABW1IGY4_9BACL